MESAVLLRNVPTDPTDGAFDALAPDADHEARQDLAERMALPSSTSSAGSRRCCGPNLRWAPGRAGVRSVNP
jgi:hypothetical protein